MKSKVWVNWSIEQARDHWLKQPPRFSDQHQWMLSLNGWKPPYKEAILLRGQEADCSEFESSGWELYGVVGGAHHGHVVEVWTDKYDCGAFSEVQKCSCGEKFENAMNGCWQYGHQREEYGERIV